MNLRQTTFQLKLVNPFGISRNTKTVSDIVLVRIDEGWGESAPIKFYNEDAGTVTETLEKINSLNLPELDYLEDVMDAIDAAIPGNQSAKAAVDIALHDRLARRLGVPLYKLFGRSPKRKW